MSQVKPAGLQVSVLQAVLLVLFFWLFFYQWGAANLQGFLNYPMMRDMGLADDRPPDCRRRSRRGR